MVLRHGVVHDHLDALHVEVGVVGGPVSSLTLLIGVFVVLILTDRLTSGG